MDTCPFLQSRNPLREVKHLIRGADSVQAIVAGACEVYAGLEGGSIVAWSTETFSVLENVLAHEESVLGLHLARNGTWLFSTGADSVVKMWSTRPLELLYSFHSSYDIGDVFSTTYSSQSQTLFWASQNGSIQWQSLCRDQLRQCHESTALPKLRKHKFFDSLDPAGVSQLHQMSECVDDDFYSHCASIFTVCGSHYRRFAHKSYIYSLLLAPRLSDQGKEEEVLISADGEGTIKLWSIGKIASDGLLQLAQFKNKGQKVKSLAIKGSLLYAGMSKGFIHIYNIESQQVVRRLSSCHGDVNQMQICNDVLFCGTNDGWITLFDNHFVKLECWNTNQKRVLAMAFVNSGQETVIVTAGDDGTIAFWSTVCSPKPAPTAAPYSNDRLINALREFVAYKSVANNPLHSSDCHAAAAFLHKQCSSFGAKTRLLNPGEGFNPILLASFEAADTRKGNKSVLFYGHYDVVDADADFKDPSSRWYSDPFTLWPADGHLYGRGVADNKAAILAALYAVADLVQQGLLSCNVKFLIEGEAETGSRGFTRAVQAYRPQIGPVDYVLLSYGTWLDDNIPCVTFGTRGIIHATLTIRSNKGELHSGMDGKSGQNEPLKDVAALLGALVGPSAKSITIPNFYTAVQGFTDIELQIYAQIASALLPHHPEIQNREGFVQSLLQRWHHPNLTIHDVDITEHRTALTIPACASATISIRIVPGQNAKRVAAELVYHLKGCFSKLQSTNTLTVKINSTANPWFGDVRSKLFSTLAKAISLAWSPDVNVCEVTESSSLRIMSMQSKLDSQDRPRFIRGSSLAYRRAPAPSAVASEPLYIRDGGSITVISFLEEEFQAQTAMFPMAQASDNPHLHNERMRLENFYNGRKVFNHIFTSL